MNLKCNKAAVILYFAFFGLILLYGVNNYFISSKFYPEPLYADEATHMTNALKYYKITANFSFDFLDRYARVENFYPPLFYIVSSIFNLIFGFSRTNSVMTNMFFYLIMLISVYLIKRKIDDNKYTGILTMFVLSMFPMVFGMSRWFMLDFSLTAMCALAICSLLYCNNFENTGKSFLCGVIIGLALITKWSIFIFLIGPFLYIFLERKASGYKTKIKNAVLALTISLFIASIFYLYRLYYVGFKTFLVLISRGNIRNCETQFPWNSFSGLTYYIQTIYIQLSPIFSLALLISAYFFIRSNVRYKGVLILWIILPYVFFTFLDNKWPRYMMPILPAIALIVAIGLGRIPSKSIKNSIISILIILGIGQYFLISYASRDTMGNTNPILSRVFDVGQDYDSLFDFNSLGYYDENYAKTSNMLKQVIKSLSGYKQKSGITERPIKVGCIWPGVIDQLRYQIFRKNIDIDMYSFYVDPEFFLGRMKEFDFLLLATSDGKNMVWPKAEQLKKQFKKYNWDNLFKLKDNDYLYFEHLLREAKSGYEPVKVFIYNNVYMYVLAKKEYKLDKISYANNYATISRGDLRLIYNNGTFSIYYKDLDLFGPTDSGGILIVFKSLSRYYASSEEARWTIEEVTADRLILNTRWLTLPVSNNLEFEIRENNSIGYKVSMAIYDKLALENVSFALTFPGRYDRYVIPSLKRTDYFPKKNSNNFKLTYLFQGNIEDTSQMGVIDSTNKNLVILSCPQLRGDYSLSAISLDDSFRTRGLVCTFNKGINKSSYGVDRQYSLFSGEIKIIDSARED